MPPSPLEAGAIGKSLQKSSTYCHRSLITTPPTSSATSFAMTLYSSTQDMLMPAGREILPPTSMS